MDAPKADQGRYQNGCGDGYLPFGGQPRRHVGLRVNADRSHDSPVPRTLGRLHGCIRLALLFAALVGIGRAADHGLPWFVRVWKTSEGLAGDYVTGIVQTDDGFIWIVAGGRLERFDGVTLQHETLDAAGGSAGRRIRQFVATRDGGIALALFDGELLRVHRRGLQTVATGLAGPGVRMEALAEAPDGAFFATMSDATVWQVRAGHAVRLGEEDGLPTGSHARFVADASGNVWFSKGDYVGVGRGDKFAIIQRFPDGSNPHVAVAHGGGVWIAAGTHLLRADVTGAVREIAVVPFKNVPFRPNVMLEDRAGAVWIGTYASGLFRFDGARFESVPISHRQVVCLTEDREGSLWVGTSGGGLNQVQPRAVTIEGGETGLPYEAVVGMAEDDHRQLWGFTQAGVLVERHNGGWRPFPGFAPQAAVNAIAAGPGETLWVGTRNGNLYRWRDGQLTTWSRADGLAAPNQRVLLAARSGDLWIASSRPGVLQRLRADKLETFPLPRAPALVRALTEDAAGNIWVGTSGRELVRIAPGGAIVDESRRIAAAPNPIQLLDAEPDGTLWLAFVQGGVGRLQGSDFGLVTTKQGLVNDNVQVMLPDGRGWMWLVAGETIFKVSETELTAVAEGRRTQLQPVRYGEEQGIRPIFGDTIGALRRRDGSLWIPMATSLAIIDPALQRAPADPPPVWVTDVTVDDQPVAVHHGVLPLPSVADVDRGDLRIGPKHRRIEIAFTALSFRTPTNVAFRYRLENFDDHWIEAGARRSVSYSRLVAGHYRFRVVACNSDGVWNDTGASVAFTVEPFFWETWWFRVGAVALFTAAVYVIARSIANRRLRQRLRAAEREAAVERERARIARDIHDDLGGRLTKIVLLSGLATREGGTPERAGERVREISETARQLIKSLDETVWAVNPKNDTLPHFVSYLGQFAVSFLRTAEIACDLDVPDDPPMLPLPAEVRHNLFLAVKEALTNVVRHARATRVWVRLALTATVLEISVADNGEGFAGDPADPEADGLRNMRHRMEQIGGAIRVDTRPDAGTHVTFTLPRPSPAPVSP